MRVCPRIGRAPKGAHGDGRGATAECTAEGTGQRRASLALPSFHLMVDHIRDHCYRAFCQQLMLEKAGSYPPAYQLI